MWGIMKKIEHKVLAIYIIVLVSTIQAFAMEEIKISKDGGCEKIGRIDSYGNTYVCTIKEDLTDKKILIENSDSDITLDGNMKSLIGQKGHIGIRISNAKTKVIIIKNFKEIRGFDTGIEIVTKINIESNTITDNDKGIIILGRDNNIINNIIIKNKIGIDISGINNVIKSNYIKDNTQFGIVPGKNSNIIYNNFLYNTNNIKVNNIVNFWNVEKDKLIDGTNIIGGKKIGGNFWGKPAGDGYSQSNDCKDADNNGICDKPYQINPNNIDRFPLKWVRDSKICVGNTKMGEKVTVAPLPNMRVYFPKIPECGNVVATKISGKFDEKGYKPKEFYDITFFDINGNVKSPNARIYIGYDTPKPEDGHLDIRHFENDKWVSKINIDPTPKPKNLPLYPLNHNTVIVGDSSLSPFAVVEIDKKMGEGDGEGGEKGIRKCTICHNIPEECTASCHNMYDTSFNTSGASSNIYSFIMLSISLLVISILILIRRNR